MTTSKPGKIGIENVNHPGNVEFVDAAMYEAMKHALLKTLPGTTPGLTVNDHGIGTLFFRAKGTPAFGVERHAGQRPIRRSWSGLHSLIGCG